MAAGADGLIVEVHTDPEQALSDGGAVAQARALRRAGAAGARHSRRRGAHRSTDEHGAWGFISQAQGCNPGLGADGRLAGAGLQGRCAALLGIDPDAQVAAQALAQNIVDEASSDPASLLPQAEVVILAAPVNAILADYAGFARPTPRPGHRLDLGSTKAQICQAMQRLPERFDPLGGHPMCGKEQGGLDNADARLFEGAAFAFTPLQRTSTRAKACALELAWLVGAHPLWLEASSHDAWAAATSHLPYLLSNALACTTPPECAPLAGPGYRSTTRLAVTPVEMMLDVLLTNQANVLAALRRYRAHLERMDEALERGDGAALRSLLTAGAARQLDILHASRVEKP